MEVKIFKGDIYKTIYLHEIGNEIGHLFFDVFSREN